MSNEKYTLSFNELAAGTVVDDEYKSKGLEIRAEAAGAQGDNPGDNKAMIFDTAKPTGDDGDLKTDNLEKALIISEDGNSSDPDDNVDGGKIFFTFDESTHIQELTVLDITVEGSIKLIDHDGGLIKELPIPTTGFNKQAVIEIDAEHVCDMIVTLGGDGAVDNLVFSNSKTGTKVEPTVGAVDGEADGELMELGYDDSNAPTDQGGDKITDGADVIFGNGGDDTIDGADGDDKIYGDSPSDAPFGTPGNDVIDGGKGNDSLYGQDGDDTLIGGEGYNDLRGGNGDDVFVGGVGSDTFQGNAGQDNLDYSGSAEAVTVNLDTGEMAGGDADNDVLNGGIDGVIGSDGDDSLTGFDFVGTDPADTFTNEIFGGKGNDTIEGLGGADILEGGDDRDLFIGGTAGDQVDGGDGGDDFDTLDLTGVDFEVVNETPDADGNSTSGTVNLLDGDNNVTGSFDFKEIEEIIGGPPNGGPGPVDGTDGPDDMGPGFTDAQGDQIDGDDGLDDTILAGDGNDTIDSGFGDDTVEGGGGDDTFVITDEGNGIDNDSIVGGETGETDGDLIDASDIGDDLTVSFDGPENGSIEDGTDQTVFEEIERIETGDGDDTINGGDDGITVDTNGGNDEVNGGDGDNDINTGDENPDLVDRGFPAYGPFSAVPADADPENDRDLVTTGSGDDTITTGDDRDTIDAGSGDNVIDSGIDDDIVTTTFGNDFIVTSEGNDTVSSGAGNDTIYGGLDPIFPDALNIDDVDGPFGPDPDPDNGRDFIEAGAGEDLVFGQDDDDTIFGGGGADTLDGGIDDDSIEGGDGKDDIIGGAGADTMRGGNDRDEFIIDSRADAIGDIADGGTGSSDPNIDNDVDTLDLRGLGRFEIVNETIDADGDSTSGTVNFIDKDGNFDGSLEFLEIENLIPCFTPGSLIATPRGEVAVEALTVGDRVITRDDGIQEIQWIGKKKIGAPDMLADPKLKPIMIRKGALGNNLPERDMMVSPNHRMLIANENTQMLFDEREVLVAAKHLIGQPGVYQVDIMATEYVHVMFDRHQVILGDGAWTESFQPGDQTLGGFDAEQREEIFKLFPSLMNETGRKAYGAARQSLKAFEARTLRETMGSK